MRRLALAPSWVVACTDAIGGARYRAMLAGPATQTPPEVTTTILAKSLFDQMHVNAHTDRWKAKLKTRGQSDFYVVDNKFPVAVDDLVVRQSRPATTRSRAATSANS
jgi:hypothetical protein